MLAGSEATSDGPPSFEIIFVNEREGVESVRELPFRGGPFDGCGVGRS